MSVYKMQEGLETRTSFIERLERSDNLEDLEVNVRLIQTGSSTTQGGSMLASFIWLRIHSSDGNFTLFIPCIF